MRFISFAAVALMVSSLSAYAGETPAPDGAKVYFINLADGATVSSPLTIQFGLSGMGVAPAGAEKENTGHHHLFINRPILGEGEDGEEELIFSIPADENHKHFGKGQTEVTLELPAGSHTLQLVLGDKDHIPHNPPVTSEQITVTVQ